MLCLPMSKRSVPSFSAYNPDSYEQKEQFASLHGTLTEVNDKKWADQMEFAPESEEAGLRPMLAIMRAFRCPVTITEFR
jgi:hypothetical protein